MVKLSFTLNINAPVGEVFNYFSRFETIKEWDPNVRESRLVSSTKDHIGDEYHLVTIWNGQDSCMTYFTTEYEHNKKITLFAENDKITSKDQICFAEGDQPKTTKFTYNANIKLKGLLKIFTVFIVSDLEKLADDTKQGVIKKVREIFPERN